MLGKFFHWVGEHKEDIVFSILDPTYLRKFETGNESWTTKDAVHESFFSKSQFGIPYWIYNKRSDNPNYNIKLDHYLHRHDINGSGYGMQSGGNMDAVYGKGGKYLGNQVNNYGGVSGLTVSSYYGWDIDLNRTGYSQSGGLEIYLSYPSENEGYWAQYVHTSDPYTYPTSPYWDAKPGSIYYDTQGRDEENNVYFYDTPQRNNDCYWYSNLYFYEEDMVVLQLVYGFTITDGKTRISPIRVAYPVVYP